MPEPCTLLLACQSACIETTLRKGLSFSKRFLYRESTRDYVSTTHSTALYIHIYLQVAFCHAIFYLLYFYLLCIKFIFLSLSYSVYNNTVIDLCKINSVGGTVLGRTVHCEKQNQNKKMNRVKTV